MRVLEIGSGAGDVAIMLAELVGTSGQVVGVDINAAILETARQRAADAGMKNVDFVAGDARTLTFDEKFDALMGRFVLMYMADPLSIVFTSRYTSYESTHQMDIGCIQTFRRTS